MNKKQQTFNFIFIIKRTRTLRNGEVPIAVRLTINGQVGDILIKRSVIPSLWDQPKERSKAKDHAGRELNNYIESVRTRIYDIRRDLEDKGKLVTLDAVRDKYYGRDTETLLRIKTIVGIYQEHNDKCRTPYRKGVYKVHGR